MIYQQPDPAGQPYQPYPGGHPYPGGPGQPWAPPSRPPTPQSVMVAFYLMLAGAVLTLLGTTVGFTQLTQIRDQIRDDAPELTDSQANMAVAVGIGSGVAVALVSAALWTWMAFASRAGKNWARITGTVFFAVNAVFFVIGLVGAGLLGTATSVVSTIFSVLVLIVGLAAVVSLWTKHSAPYFRPVPPGGYHPYPGG